MRTEIAAVGRCLSAQDQAVFADIIVRMDEACEASGASRMTILLAIVAVIARQLSDKTLVEVEYIAEQLRSMVIQTVREGRK